MARRWRVFLFLICTIPLIVFGYDRGNMIGWDGSTELESVFIVTDASTNQPIPGATIAFHPEIHDFDDTNREWVKVTTDLRGVYRKECQRMCGGEMSGLRFTNTFGVSLPSWDYVCEAEGYQISEVKFLGEPENRKRMQMVDRRKPRLIIPITLTKSSKP